MNHCSIFFVHVKVAKVHREYPGKIERGCSLDILSSSSSITEKETMSKELERVTALVSLLLSLARLLQKVAILHLDCSSSMSLVLPEVEKAA
jgi:hypothetical protein